MSTNIFFFDCLPSVHRKRSNGNIVSLDDLLPFSLQLSNDFEVRKDDADLVYGKGATAGLKIYNLGHSSKLVEARIDHDISEISSDGLVLTVPLTLSVPHNHTRFFSLTFYDRAGAVRFFDAYRMCLPSKVSKDLEPLRFTFQDMVNRSRALEDLEQGRSLAGEAVRGEEEATSPEVVEGEKEDKEEEVEVLSDNDNNNQQQVMMEGPPRKRKRLDPELEAAQDPILEFNKEFANQYGESQQYLYF